MPRSLMSKQSFSFSTHHSARDMAARCMTPEISGVKTDERAVVLRMSPMWTCSSEEEAEEIVGSSNSSS